MFQSRHKKMICFFKQMSANPLCRKALSSETYVAGDVIGVNECKWFVTVVRHNTEKSTKESLQKLDYKPYVAKQTVNPDSEERQGRLRLTKLSIPRSYI